MSAVRKGEPWGSASTGPAEVVVAGDDAALAEVVGAHACSTRIEWRPTADADFARAVGISPAPAAARSGFDLPCDALEVSVGVGDRGGDDASGIRAVDVTVNMVVVGVGPDRVRRRTPSAAMRVEVDDRVVHDGPATGVVVANGEYLRGADLIPRGHPGDGRLEVQVYAVAPGERRSLRTRVRTASHVPHPAIVQASGASVVVSTVDASGRPLELDGKPRGVVTWLRARVVPQRFVLVT